LGFIRRLEASLRAYSRGYLHRYRATRADKKAEIVLPIEWERDPDFVWFEKEEARMEEDQQTGEAARRPVSFLKFWILGFQAKRLI
jgi:hypothetical protein